MKKFIVKYKDSGKVFGEFASKEEASDKVMEFINGHYISPFDFELEEVECNDVNEVITDFESARRALGGKSNEEFTVSRKVVDGGVVCLEDMARLINDINPKNLEALVALNELFTIAEAWNKSDRFVPDFSNVGQYKYYPWFVYDKEDGRFVYADANNTTMYADANVGSRLCFQSYARAKQFGKQFVDLYNKVLLS